MARHDVDIVVAGHDKASRVFGKVGRSSRILTVTLKKLAVSFGVYFGAREIGRLLKYGASFEKTMSRVGALSQATAADQDRLTKAAQRLGETTAFTAKQVGEGMSFLALAGFDVNQVIASMPATLNLAAAGQLDLAQAADITAKIMKGMGHDTNDLNNDVDILAKAFTTANTDLVQLGEAMQYVGPIGRMAGKGLEELTAAIQVMSNAGIQASTAGTALRQIIAALSGGTPAATRNLKELGITTTDTAGKLLPLANIIDQFNQKLAGMGKAEQTARVMEIFGKRAGPGMAAMLAEGGDALRKYEHALEDAAGTALQIAEKQLDNVAGEMTKIASVASGIWIGIFEKMKGWLKDYLQLFREGLMVMGVVVENFGLVMDIVWTKIKLELLLFAGDIKYVFCKFIPDLLSWFARNWKEVFTSIWRGTKAIFVNMYKNITEFFKAVWSWLKGEGFDFTWTALLEGFESTLKELPVIFARELSETERVLKAKLDKLKLELAEKIIVKFEGEPGETAKAIGEAVASALAEADIPGKIKADATTTKGRLAAQEAELLTFAPGTKFDYARQMAKDTQEQTKIERELLKYQKDMVKELREGNKRRQDIPELAVTAFA